MMIYNLLPCKIIMILSIVIISGLTVPSFSVVQAGIDIPSGFQDVKDFVMQIIKQLPEKIKDIWQNRVVPVWRSMMDRGYNWWETSVLPWLKNIFPTIKQWLNQVKDWLSNIWYEKIKPWIAGSKSPVLNCDIARL